MLSMLIHILCKSFDRYASVGYLGSKALGSNAKLLDT